MNGNAQSGTLRARKKALTRNALEETALRMFLDRGYERARLEDICAACDLSMRTFFRYFTSKEDLVLGRLRAQLELAGERFAQRPTTEPLRVTLRTVIGQNVTDLVAEPRRELTRLRLVASTPMLTNGLAAVFAGFERLVERVAAARLPARDQTRQARLLAAAAVAAFRVGLDLWVDQDAKPDLAELILGNLETLAGGLLSAAR